MGLLTDDEFRNPETTPGDRVLPLTWAVVWVWQRLRPWLATLGLPN